MSPSPLRISFISAGSWGTALALLANRTGSKATLYTKNINVFESISTKRMNDVYLPGVFIDPRIDITMDISATCKTDMVVLAVPSQHVRSLCISISDQLEVGIPIILATKGIERGSLSLMSDIVAEILPKNPLAILTGPSFASEAAQNNPTATTIACEDKKVADDVIYGIGGRYFRPYYTDDIIGAQIGGAVKNVIAIACGIATGKGLGENARAAIITRGVAEMMRLCLAKGGRRETLMGLSGIGDLMLTCSSTTSRNMSLGIELGKSHTSVKETLDTHHKKLAEGITTAESVTELASKLGVSMPICRTVHDILRGDLPIDRAIASLLERPYTAEM